MTYRELAVRIATLLAARFEGLSLHPYLCPAGVPTIGYGATYYENGIRVTLSDPAITRERAMQLLVWMVTHIYLPKVMKLCPKVDTPQRLAGLIDFSFNLGPGSLAASTLRKRVNVGAWDLAKIEIKRWNKSAGRILRGLTLRRQAESNLF